MYPRHKAMIHHRTVWRNEVFATSKKGRTRILLPQATDEVVRSLWPFAAETAAAQQQAEAWGQLFPSVAQFGSKSGRVTAKGEGPTSYRSGWRAFTLVPQEQYLEAI